MARSRISAKTIRDLAPVLVPLVTRIAVPMAVRSIRRRSEGLGDALEGVRDHFEKSAKKTRGDFDDVRDDAVERGKKVYDDALAHGTKLIDEIASKGIEAAEEWARALGRPPRRRFPWGKVFVVGAVVAVGFVMLTRD